MKSHQVEFKTQIEYKGERMTVKVEGSFSPGYSEQEYPGAHKWTYPSSWDLEVMLDNEDGDIITDELTDAQEKMLEAAAGDVMAGEMPRSEFDAEDEAEARADAWFEEAAYGRPDSDY